jgi:hypothetical protein
MTVPLGRIGGNVAAAQYQTIHADLYSVSGFSTAPVTAADLQTAITAFSTAKIAQATGGQETMVIKDQRRAELAELLKQLAYYVQMACNGDLAVLLSSGFKAASRNRTPSALPKATVLRISQDHSGVALVTAKVERGARTYVVEAAEMDENGLVGPYGPPVFQSSSRKIPMAGLTPGKVYLFRVRVVGGSGETSEWSDSVTQRML